VWLRTAAGTLPGAGRITEHGIRIPRGTEDGADILPTRCSARLERAGV
jgi:hypothetical protein